MMSSFRWTSTCSSAFAPSRFVATSRRFFATYLCEIFLDESRAQMHIHLHERHVSDARETVNLSGLDDEDVAGGGFEGLAVHRIESAAFPDELDFVVRVTMRTWSASRLAMKEK